MLAIKRCVWCSAELQRARRGRPRLYCSDACRDRARRFRQASELGGQPLAYGEVDPAAGSDAPGDVEEELASSPLELPRDPDEAVVEAILRARQAAASFGLAARRARPQLAFRCERAAEEIAALLRRHFSP
jgi:hypothetical protein